MTKKVEENVNSPFKGGLSMFGMDFASKGLSWAGNVYQRWENLCLDNIQDPSRFVDAVGEHFRKICDEVAEDWRYPFADGCVKGPVSDLSLEQDVIAEVYKKRSKINPDEQDQDQEALSHQSGVSLRDPVECPVNEESSIPAVSEPTVSSEEDMSSASSLDIPPDTSNEEAYEMLNKKVIPTPLEVKGYNCSENKIEERGLMLSCTVSTEENGTSTSRGISLLGSFGNEHGQQSNANALEVSLSIMEIADTECSDGFDREEAVRGSNAAAANMEPIGEFEDVNLDDCWDDAEQNELALISYRASKNKSYKKKLRDAITSKVRSLKNYEQVANCYSGADMGMAKRDGTTASSVSCRVLDPKNSSTKESSESDWELL